MEDEHLECENNGYDELCNKDECMICYNNSLLSIINKGKVSWLSEYNKNINPRNIHILSDAKFWFRCNECKFRMYCDSKRLRLEECCYICKVRNSNLVKHVLQCQQGHMYYVKSPRGEYPMLERVCPYCDMDVETYLYHQFSKVFTVYRRPHFKWSRININGEYITYNLYILEMNLLIELSSDKYEDLDRSIEKKINKAQKYGYKVMELFNNDVKYGQIDWVSSIGYREREKENQKEKEKILVI